MDVREKLVELLVEFVEVDAWDNGEFIEKDIDFGKIAENLIAYGVTVQEWISVKDRLPEKEGNYLIYVTVPFNGRKFMTVMHYKKYDGASIWNETTHWMPLPQPPKGD